ncbi:YjgN family protein [Thalassospiraceae bacterium LMO-JJ14]|nr:YjgN family protein [Thalassospiraceae bacterium LMO-JJ14]
MDQAPENQFKKVHDPADAETHAFAFNGTRPAFARLLAINTLLTLLTIGIYRFWAKTKIRRFFWRNVTFLDDPLEYTGTGGELFVGFLIVIAVLFPLGLIYSAIGAVVPPAHPELEIALEVAYYIVLFALLQIGFYRMWRYRMSRTMWRGVRFGLDGSTWAYLKLSAGWSVLTALTLGAAYPWMKIDLWRYQIRHTRLGDQAFRFEGNAKALFAAWSPVFVIGLLYIATLITFLYNFGFEPAEIARALREDQNGLFKTIMFVFAGLGLLSIIAYFHYAIRQARFQISGIRLGEARFHSGLPFKRLFWFAALTILIFVLALAAVSGTFGITIYSGISHLPGDGLQASAASAVVGLYVIVFVMLLLIAPFVWALVFKFELIKQTVKTTAVTDPHVLENAAQIADRGPRTGEGLADALDIGGF